MGMEPNWLSTVAVDPSWVAVIGVIGALGLTATLVTLVRQGTPPTRIDRERVARRREVSGRLAH